MTRSKIFFFDSYVSKCPALNLRMEKKSSGRCPFKYLVVTVPGGGSVAPAPDWADCPDYAAHTATIIIVLLVHDVI